MSSSWTTPTLSKFWPEMTQEERVKHFTEVGERYLDHRYRYYVLDAPVLADQEFDWLERYYELLAKELNLPATASDMVDFDHDRPNAQAAKARVDSGIDHHSLWEAEMRLVWERCGKSKVWDQRKDASNGQQETPA